MFEPVDLRVEVVLPAAQLRFVRFGKGRVDVAAFAFLDDLSGADVDRLDDRGVERLTTTFGSGVTRRPRAVTIRSVSDRLAQARKARTATASTCIVIRAWRGSGRRSISSASGRKSRAVCASAVFFC